MHKSFVGILTGTMLVVWTSFGLAQNIGGTVVEKGTTTPINGALVVIDGTSKQFTTGTNGGFSIFYNPTYQDVAIEAESMTLSGYIPYLDSRLSGVSIMVDPNGSGSGTATSSFTGASGTLYN